jgi:TRAP-type C4-dicarboxylate transport system permease large subunit
MPLMTPVIIVGGIITGVFTPTEAAIAAVAYSAILGLVVYRTLGHRDRTLSHSADRGAVADDLRAVLHYVAADADLPPTLIYR